jgi:anti-sigma factor RsiW
VSDGWHPREELSAFLDGELADDVAERIEVHCLVCSSCAMELDAARHARRDLRHLPAVEPPPGFLEALLAAAAPGPTGPGGRRHQRGGWWIGNAAVAVALGLALVVTSAGDPDSTADASMFVGDAVRQHAAVTAAVSSDHDGTYPSPRRVAELGRPYVAPAELAGFRLVDAFEVPGGVQLLYERGSEGLSVFETPGSAERESSVFAGHRVEVVSRGGLVVMIVGASGSSSVRAAAAQLDGGPSAPARFRRACGDVLAGLSPAG